jgi:hypothetical protein
MATEKLHLEGLSCDYLELKISFSPDQFEERLFREAVKKNPDRAGPLSVTCASKNHPGAQHAHIRVDIRKNGPSVANVFYTTGSEGKTPTAPQDIEDCLEWLVSFFTVQNIEAELDGAFTFSEQYAPIVPLPFPLPSEHEALAGALVSGLSLEFPRRPELDRIIIQRVGKRIGVQAQTRIQLVLATVNGAAIISRLHRIARDFVKKKGGSENEQL